jgi:hypothetical protein
MEFVARLSEGNIVEFNFGGETLKRYFEIKTDGSFKGLCPSSYFDEDNIEVTDFEVTDSVYKEYVMALQHLPIYIGKITLTDDYSNYVAERSSNGGCYSEHEVIHVIKDGSRYGVIFEKHDSSEWRNDRYGAKLDPFDSLEFYSVQGEDSIIDIPRMEGEGYRWLTMKDCDMEFLNIDTLKRYLHGLNYKRYDKNGISEEYNITSTDEFMEIEF